MLPSNAPVGLVSKRPVGKPDDKESVVEPIAGTLWPELLRRVAVINGETPRTIKLVEVAASEDGFWSTVDDVLGERRVSKTDCVRRESSRSNL